MRSRAMVNIIPLPSPHFLCFFPSQNPTASLFALVLMKKINVFPLKKRTPPLKTPSSISFLSLSLQPIPTFLGKPLPASLFISQQVWAPQTPAWRLLQLVPRMERGPPHTSRVLPAPLIYIKKLNTPWLFKGGLHIVFLNVWMNMKGRGPQFNLAHG